MVANRMESNKDGAEKIERPQPPAPAPAASTTGTGGGFKAWLPLLVTFVTMPALAYAVTTFVLLPKLQSGLGVTPAAHSSAKETKPAKDPEAKKETAAMGKLLVNVAGSMGSRYLMTSLTVVGTGADFRAKIERNDPQLRDAAGTVLSAKSLADLERPGARNVIRSELISAFNNILGGPVVQELFLTEFAVQ